MGGSNSKLEKQLGTSFPENEKLLGMENVKSTWCCSCFQTFLQQFGNTCYANSVLQALFFCPPFRTKLLEWHGRGGGEQNSFFLFKLRLSFADDYGVTLLSSLAQLFFEMTQFKRRSGVVAPKQFVTTLKRENGGRAFPYLIHQLLLQNFSEA